jgi:putative flippase GtrA
MRRTRRDVVGRRFTVFAVGGGLIGLAGLVLLAWLVRLGMGHGPAYATQLLLTLAANFVFTRHVTFRDRRGALRGAQVWRFAGTRGVTLVGGWLLFMAQVDGLGVPYLAASATCLAVTSAVNYVTSDTLVFAEVPVR